MYRSDIDGLRAIAVISVIAFHSGISVFSGGYVGVDVFFVISGYLITTLIYKEILADTFSFRNFYKRRAARLLPALSITLLITLIFGSIFYNNSAFDNFGKELFYSSFGAANILFAQGVNYFTKDEAYQPLIHLWSLGVEEQFYLIWPVILLFTFKFSKRLVIPVATLLFFISLILSILVVDKGVTKGYFLLHYRAFELLFGVLTALLLLRYPDNFNFTNTIKKYLSYFGLLLVIFPMIILDEKSSFPGYNALLPCFGASLIIAFPNQGLITKVLSNIVFVFIGLISYPLYLFHQPVTSYLHFFNSGLKSIEIFFIVTSISVCAAWLTFKFFENPIRKLAHSTTRRKAHLAFWGLILTIPFFTFSGLLIAKSNGLKERFEYLNPFALEIDKAHSASFHNNFERGFEISPPKHGQVLFVGDSVLQQYVLPFTKAFNFKNIDTVTRGGCVLLKGTDFIDKFSDISCDELRYKLYQSEKRYDYVVISQLWKSYNASVLNFSDSKDIYKRWELLLDETVEHFLKFSDKVIIIGGHPKVDGTMKLQPSLRISKESYLSDLEEVTIKNISQLESSGEFFSKYTKDSRVLLLEPYSIFCSDKCLVNDGKWSYFSDSQHISNASTSFVKTRLSEIIQE
ncbi:acyltransferase family protein [Pseudoalteromonas distincta]|uniref:acyltransferase family protein n=1 Tax=Pseudoalteromonas distincta TaxID=77608 RepID=UPI0039EBCFDF